MLTRRTFLKLSAGAGALAVLPGAQPLRMPLFAPICRPAVRAERLLGSLAAAEIPKYEVPLLIPPAMPKLGRIRRSDGGTADYYVIAVRQFEQQILPPGLPATTVWGYGARNQPGTVGEGGTFNFPSFTVEARVDTPVRVRWVNELVDSDGNYLPHLLPVDQTLHWANPPGGAEMRDMHGMDGTAYRGPVPMVPHVHGAHTTQENDGYPEAWWLPAAKDIPEGYATEGRFYDEFKASSPYGRSWQPGSAVFEYPNDQHAMTSWFHDHSLGMTRLNVYAGPAGFFLLRGGDNDLPDGVLPGPAPQLGDAPDAKYYEIPIAIQDRSFNEDGSLFYPDSRAFFEGVEPDELQIPLMPELTASGAPSDVAPIWVPEFFGDTMVVNGRTWPYLEVEQRRYRLRLLNGCNARFLLLEMDGELPFYQIGAEGGFLAAVAEQTQLLLAPAERADVIVDFSDVPVGTEIVLRNLAPDDPYGGGTPGVDFEPADAETTGQVMQFRVVAATGPDESTPPSELVLPAVAALGTPAVMRRLALIEEFSRTVRVARDDDEEFIVPIREVEGRKRDAVPFGPTEAHLGVIAGDGMPVSLSWDDPVALEIEQGVVEEWEILNLTADAHPIHVHQIMFQVVEREIVAEHSPMYAPDAGQAIGYVEGPKATETGWKDTVIVYPGEIARIRVRFDVAGRFVWHCHILEHEDNEMMLPLDVVAA